MAKLTHIRNTIQLTGTVKELAPGILVDLERGQVSVGGSEMRPVREQRLLTLLSLGPDYRSAESLADRLKINKGALQVNIHRLREEDGIPIDVKRRQGYALKPVATSDETLKLK